MIPYNSLQTRRFSRDLPPLVRGLPQPVRGLPPSPYSHRRSMSLTLDDVKRIAMLARIGLAAADAAPTLGPLNAVLGLIERLPAVDTRGADPVTHPGEHARRPRDDVVDEPQRRDDYQAMAPSVERGLYLVPRVIE